MPISERLEISPLPEDELPKIISCEATTLVSEDTVACQRTIITGVSQIFKLALRFIIDGDKIDDIGLSLSVILADVEVSGAIGHGI